MTQTDGLALEAVSKAFGRNLAVDSVTAYARPGRVLGLLGPNGAGKSTLLHMACGLLTPDSGEVRLDGTPIRRLGSGLYRQLSAVLEDSSLTYMFLRGWDNLDYQGALYGFTRRETRTRAAEAIGVLGLAPHMGKVVGDWSRGTQQKLAVVTALLPRPRVLLLDEPTLGLDVVAKRDLIEAIRRLAGSGTAVLLASHQSDVIEALADDIVLIRSGRAQWVGTLDGFLAEHVSSAPAAAGSAASPGVDGVRTRGPALEDVLLAIFGSDEAAGGLGDSAGASTSRDESERR